ncbi:Chloride channel protein CLC-a [Hibiscus syriacus]|uniref:Chloride channel protein CLC-a n=1 Tax=Hibiscus syriacus TaxID=106335 RepID=A0A6A3BFL1_HIBSY|nr:Chloride channel protein CLC-a [Hibiscus syriacus]
MITSSSLYIIHTKRKDNNQLVHSFHGRGGTSNYHRSRVQVLQYVFFKWLLAFLVGLLTGLIITLINLAIEKITGYKLLVIVGFIKDESRFWNSRNQGLNLVRCYNTACQGLTHAAGNLPVGMMIVGSIGAVSADLDLGKEGPLVHIASCIASLLAQGGPDNYRLKWHWLRYFNNDRDLRDIITCGSSSGVCSAFRAAVGAVVVVVLRAFMEICSSGKCSLFGTGGLILFDICDVKVLRIYNLINLKGKLHKLLALGLLPIILMGAGCGRLLGMLMGPYTDLDQGLYVVLGTVATILTELHGLILRAHLVQALKKKWFLIEKRQTMEWEVREKFNWIELSERELKIEQDGLIHQEMEMYVDLHLLTNITHYTVVESMSVAKAMVLFRQVGIRHMLIVPKYQGAGMVDLQQASVQSPVNTTVTSSSYGSSVLSSVQHIPKQDVIKLTESTYLFWKHQVTLIIDGYGLLAYISGDSLAPSQFVANESGQLEENPVYDVHRQQDKLLASWLLTTVSMEVLLHLTGFTFARTIWNAVSRLFGVRSSAKISSLRHNLHYQRKVGLIVIDYLAKIKTIFDLLNAVGCDVLEQEQVSVILAGLSMEFESIIAIASRDVVSLDSLTEMLLDCEARKKDFLSDDIAANMVIQPKEENGSRSQAVTKTDTTEKQFYSMRGQQGGYRGRGRGRFNNSNRPQCQLCGKFGHIVQRCYRHFDRDFTGVANEDQSAEQWKKPSEHIIPVNGHAYNHTLNSHVMNTFPGDCVAHPTSTEGQESFVHTAPIAFVSTVPSMAPAHSVPKHSNVLWYPDTSATHHVSNDLVPFNSGMSYKGNNTLLMGNGEGIKIDHVGQGFLSSSFRPLVLQNMLHVPHIKKKLLSVSQFTRDNNVFIEFHPFECLMKDAQTRTIMLRGKLTRKGLYQLLLY